jgi:uncharacterized protein YjbI with pentapeptide repeats
VGLFWFSSTKPQPRFLVKNVLGEVIDELPVWDLAGQCLRGKQWPHADLSGLSLDGADCSGINLFGARLVKTSFSRCNLRDAEVSFSDATGANFSNANLEGCLMYRSETSLAHFDGAVFSERSDIPGLKRVIARTTCLTQTMYPSRALTHGSGIVHGRTLANAPRRVTGLQATRCENCFSRRMLRAFLRHASAPRAINHCSTGKLINSIRERRERPVTT